MTHAAAAQTSLDTPMGWLRSTEAWLDEKGKGAWIALMVLGFIFIWPVGLATLFYMIWGKKMFKNNCHRSASRRTTYSAKKSSGNSVFDAYKADTLRRLEDEQNNFETFLERLRAAKDKSEFDTFMDERAKKARADTDIEETEKADA